MVPPQSTLDLKVQCQTLSRVIIREKKLAKCEGAYEKKGHSVYRTVSFNSPHKIKTVAFEARIFLTLHF